MFTFTRLALLILLLTACGGSSETSGENLSQSVTLSGVIGITDDISAVSSDNPLTASRIGSTPTRQIVVMAIDLAGNSYATATDGSGYFEFTADLGIQSQTAYALVFIDMATLDIMATLGVASGEAATLILEQNTELPEIVIDPSVKLAAVTDDLNAQGGNLSLTVQASNTLDQDDNGQITYGEIMSALTSTIQAGQIDTITAVSAFTFIGQQNTWTLSIDIEDDAWEDSLCDWIDLDNPPAGYPTSCDDDDDTNDPLIAFLADTGEMTVLRTEQVAGPDGTLVDATKLLELTYLNYPYPDEESEYADMVDLSLLWDTGYASGSQADINASASVWGSEPGTADTYWSPYVAETLGAPPGTAYTQRMGLLGWSEYGLADSASNKLLYGQKEKDDESGSLVIEWGDTSLPLNLPINTPFLFTDTETDESIDPVSGDEIIEVTTVTSEVVVTLATNSDSTPALLAVADGNETLQLPVFQIRFTDPDNNESECSYIIARYGIEGDDADENCDDSTDWLESFSDIRFGKIQVVNNQPSVIDQTPAAIIANDSGDQGLPIDNSGQLTEAGRNWLTYLYANAGKIDYSFEPVTRQDEEDWSSAPVLLFYVEHNDEQPVFTPAELGFAGSDKTLLVMGEAPGTITLNRVHYQSSEQGVAFYVDVRTPDSNNESGSVYTSPIAATPSADTSAPTDSDQRISLTATLPELPAAQDPIWAGSVLSVETLDMAEAQVYETLDLTVWLIMQTTDDPQNIQHYEYPIAKYRAVNPTPVD